MATATFLTVSEYLHSSYEPDAEYVEGRIEERAVGELDHSGLQRKLLLLLSQTAMEASFVCYPELRVQVSAERYRVPDLMLVRVDAPRESIVVTPPLLCIEILSPEDTVRRMMVRVNDFLLMGVPEVWIVDSESRTIQVCTPGGSRLHTEGALQVPQTSAQVKLAEVFSVLR